MCLCAVVLLHGGKRLLHISLPTSTLIAILVGVIICGLLLRLIDIRHKYRTEKPATPRKRSPLRIASPRPSRRDHGATVARKYGLARSTEWPRVAKEHLLLEPACRICGHQGQGLQVHHIKPFHLYPQLELDPHNLITLCELRGRDHHLLIGHLDDWESYNPNVRADVKRFHKENATKIRSNPAWQKEVLRRPKP